MFGVGALTLHVKATHMMWQCRYSTSSPSNKPQFDASDTIKRSANRASSGCGGNAQVEWDMQHGCLQATDAAIDTQTQNPTQQADNSL